MILHFSNVCTTINMKSNRNLELKVLYEERVKKTGDSNEFSADRIIYTTISQTARIQVRVREA